MNLPQVNDNVIGRHILGAPYSGTITNVRQHSINADLFECMIVLSKPTQFGWTKDNQCDDVRTELIASFDLRITYSVSKLVTDALGRKPKLIAWTDGNGGYFNVL
jgi:hypothetical protein